MMTIRDLKIVLSIHRGQSDPGWFGIGRITSYNVCYTKLLRLQVTEVENWTNTGGLYTAIRGLWAAPFGISLVQV